MIAKVIVKSPNLDTYRNIIATLCLEYKDLDKVILSFMNNELSQEKVVNDIREKLNTLSKDYHNQSKLNKISLDNEDFNLCEEELFKNCDIVDVTAIDKESAIQIATSAIPYRQKKVCLLSFKEYFKKGEDWVLKDNNYEYKDLMNLDILLKLNQDFIKKKIIINGFIMTLVFFVCIFVLQLLYPNFEWDRFNSLVSLVFSTIALIFTMKNI